MEGRVDPGKYYNVTIRNDSTASSSYAIFSEVFSAKPTPHEPITSNVLASFRSVPHGGVVSVNIPRTELHAVCGKISEAAGTGLEAQVLSTRPVSLGVAKEGDVDQEYGTALMVGFVGGSPEFSATAASEKVAKKAGPGCFAIHLSDSFTSGEAKGAGFIVGIGLSQAHINAIGPSVKFCPSPNQTYTIKPNSIFYILSEEHDPGALVTEDMKTVGNTAMCKVEFSQARTRVIITQNARRQLVVNRFSREFNL